MFRQVQKRVVCGDEPLVLCHTNDMRYTRSALASSHDGTQLHAMRTANPWTDEAVRAAADKADVIGVDEGQFMECLVQFCEHYASRGKHVIVAALDGTFEQKPWPQITPLIAVAEHVVKLHAVCVVCHAQASFTRRLDASNNAERDIGGAEKYVACCRRCLELDALPTKVLEQYTCSLRRIALLQSQ